MHYSRTHSIRSTTYSVHQKHRESGEEEKLEDNYSNELSSPGFIKSGDLLADDYDLDMCDVPLTFPISYYSSAGRLFEDERQDPGGLRDRSTPSTDGLATLAGKMQIESPLPPTKNDASNIDATPTVPVQSLSENGLPEELGAGMEPKRSQIEKESQLKNLARDLLYELKSLKNAVETMDMKHEVQVAAIHASYEKVIRMRPTEDTSKVDAMRVMADSKLAINVRR